LGGKMMVCLDKNLALLIMEISGIIRRKKKAKKLYISSGMILFFAKDLDHYY
jgi:hypothetical protein